MLNRSIQCTLYAYRMKDERMCWMERRPINVYQVSDKGSFLLEKAGNFPMHAAVTLHCYYCCRVQIRQNKQLLTSLELSIYKHCIFSHLNHGHRFHKQSTHALCLWGTYPHDSLSIIFSVFSSFICIYVCKYKSHLDILLRRLCDRCSTERRLVRLNSRSSSEPKSL